MFKTFVLALALSTTVSCTTYTQSNVKNENGTSKKSSLKLSSTKEESKPEGAATLTSVGRKGLFDSGLNALIENVYDSNDVKVAGAKFMSWKGYPDKVYLSPGPYRVVIQCNNGTRPGIYNYHTINMTFERDQNFKAFCLAQKSGIMIVSMQAFITEEEKYEAARKELEEKINRPRRSKKELEKQSKK